MPQCLKACGPNGDACGPNGDLSPYHSPHGQGNKDLFMYPFSADVSYSFVQKQTYF